MQILQHREIIQKINRLAVEILEHNWEETELILAGINNNGLHFAQLLHQRLADRAPMPIYLTRIRINPANPVAEAVSTEMPLAELNGKSIIVVDDVANTGRTIFYACKPLLDIIPNKVEVAVLVDRKHKSFPVKVDYMGISLATTLKENIEVLIKEEGNYRVNLI